MADTYLMRKILGRPTTGSIIRHGADMGLHVFGKLKEGEYKLNTRHFSKHDRAYILPWSLEQERFPPGRPTIEFLESGYRTISATLKQLSAITGTICREIVCCSVYREIVCSICV